MYLLFNKISRYTILYYDIELHILIKCHVINGNMNQQTLAHPPQPGEFAVELVKESAQI